MMHIGFTGTRFGMTDRQHSSVAALVAELTICKPFAGHHGLCVGADSQFHHICRAFSDARVIGHPGPDWPNGDLCSRVECDVTLPPLTHMKRNRAIVSDSHAMIATPFEDEPQERGGTWATIRMALRALLERRLTLLYVIGRDGQQLDPAGLR